MYAHKLNLPKIRKYAVSSHDKPAVLCKAHVYLYCPKVMGILTAFSAILHCTKILKNAAIICKCIYIRTRFPTF
jgi:hypothetical protein